MTDPITFGYSLQTITFVLGNRLLVTDYWLLWLLSTIRNLNTAVTCCYFLCLR